MEEEMVTYEDNTGDSIENAIVIKGASGSLEGVYQQSMII